MGTKFITSLSREADDVDFRVIAEEGGYSDAILELYRNDRGALLVTAQRDQTKLLIEVTAFRDQIARDGNLFCFDGFIGEFLDTDGRETGNFVQINRLSIDPAIRQGGQTVGVLKMTGISPIPNHIGGNE